MQNKNILFILSGSIACYKACEIVAKLRLKNKVQVVMTSSATKFVGTATLEALTGIPVLTDTFEEGKALDHIYKIREADAIVVAPATANFINKMAQGLGDDLALTMLLAHDFKKPLILAPAMNTNMYRHPATKKSLEVLKSWGVTVVSPASGVLACGEEGEGKLADSSDVVAAIEKSLRPKESLRVLITSGGTQEAIDDVRVLTNKSTGRTGAKIADAFINEGVHVTYLGSKLGFKPEQDCEVKEFTSFKDLEMKLKEELSKHFDVVIHSAAVSDFSVKPAKGKLSSDETPTLSFVKNPKLVDSLKKWSVNKKVKVVAFKLTAGATVAAQKKAVEKLLSHAVVDYVVSNDISQINKSQHPSLIYSKEAKVLNSSSTKEELGQSLLSIFLKK